jgi:hypothetical protein
MQFRLLLCIGMGVFVIHIGVFMLISHLRPAPAYKLPPKPNFVSKSSTVVDPKTGEKTIYREITVSTKFAPTSPTPPPDKPQLDTAAAQ